MKEIEQGMLSRTELLLGHEAIERIQSAKVILFGVGGVGSWAAESLVRSGIRNLTIVDSDVVCVTNINRQLMATSKTIGQVKVDVLRERLLSINPQAQIQAVNMIYDASSADSFHLEDYDCVLDCIDSLASKALLIRRATATSCLFLSSMGAALKMDPTRVKVAEFWKVEGCPLAARLRARFRKEKDFPARKFQCVFSDEQMTNQGICREESIEGPAPMSFHKMQTNGAIAHITAIFGFTLAGLALKQIIATR